jgi:hypothetical protein
MKVDQSTIDWLLDSDPSLRWQVERDIVGLPEAVWSNTKARTATEGFGARLLALQDEDGQWAGGAHFPKRHDPRALTTDDDATGQPYTSTGWSLNSLREFGVPAAALGDTEARLEKNCRWEYQDLPYWDGEVDCCINAFTLQNGIWLGRDMTKNAQWFLDHQLEDGGWNCEWIEGDLRSSFHSTINSLIGLLDYETQTGKNASISAARARAEEYLLERRGIYKLSTGEPVGPWIKDLHYPFRWSYSAIKALNYFRDSAIFAGGKPDPRLAELAEILKSMANENGRWETNDRLPGQIWFEINSPVGEESQWITYFAIRALTWWDSQS